MKKVCGILLCLFALSGCATSGYKTFYTAIDDPKTNDQLLPLAPGAQPTVYTTSDLENDIVILRARNYAVVGESSFNGVWEDHTHAVDQAKMVGASVILISTEYTNTETAATTLVLPDTQTTYYSGTAYGYGGSASMTGTATTYGSKSVPIVTNYRRYDQTAVFFAPRKKKPRFGIQGTDIPVEMRRELGRNTGVLIDVVVDDSPAFYSDVLRGDVLIEINGDPVRSLKEAYSMLDAIPETEAETVFTVLRNNEEKRLTLKLSD